MDNHITQYREKAIIIRNKPFDFIEMKMRLDYGTFSDILAYLSHSKFKDSATKTFAFSEPLPLFLPVVVLPM